MTGHPDKGEPSGLAGVYAHPTATGAIFMAYCVCGARFTGACESVARAAHSEHVRAGHAVESQPNAEEAK